MLGNLAGCKLQGEHHCSNYGINATEGKRAATHPMAMPRVYARASKDDRAVLFCAHARCAVNRAGGRMG